MLTISSILKDSTKFTSISILSKAINFPVALIVANVLGPKDYGILGYVMLFITYAGWFSFGTMSTAYREMPGLIQCGKIDQAKSIQNYGITFDLISTSIVFVILIIIALFQNVASIKFILILFTIGFFVTRFNFYLGSINFSFYDFSLSAKGQFIQAIMTSIATLCLIYFLKIYTPPIVSIFVTLTVTIYFLTMRKYDIKINFSKKELLRMSRIGIALNVNTIFYTLFSGVADRTIIAIYLTKQELGLYLFAYNIYFIISEIFSDFGRILQPKIWALAHTSETTIEGFSSFRNLAVYLAIISLLLIGFSQIGFILLVNVFAIKYLESQWVFIVLISYVFWGSQQMFPNLILLSSRINKQNLLNLIYVLVIIINVLLDILFVYMGFGVIGIAVATTASQVLCTIILYILSSKYIFDNKTEFYSFLKKVFTPYIIVIFVTIMNIIFLNSLPLFLMICMSIIMQVLIYYFFITMFYSKVINKDSVLKYYKTILKK